MAIATLCQPIVISGGLDPQSMVINAVSGSNFPATNSVTGYYTVNGGAQQSLSAVSPYTETVTGLSAGDTVTFCIDVDVDANVDDTGTLSISGSFTQIDADACEKSYEFSANCQWTAIDPNAAPILPTCPDDVSITCDDLPYTLSGFQNAVSFSVTSPYTVTPNAANTQIVINSTSPADGDVTVTALNADGSCGTIVTVSGCTTAPLPNCPGFQNWAIGTPIPGNQVGTGMTVVGLPNGLSYDPVGGLISGTPISGGPTSGAITVTNADGESCAFGYLVDNGGGQE